MRKIKTAFGTVALFGKAFLPHSTEAKQPKQITLTAIGRSATIFKINRDDNKSNAVARAFPRSRVMAE